MDWDKFIEETTALERSMRDVAARSEQSVAESRRQRTRAAAKAVRRLRAERAREATYETARRSSSRFVVREGSGDVPESPLEARFKAYEGETRYVLAEIRHDLLMLRRDVARMREQMATKAELESLHGDVKMVAEGFAETQTRLKDTADLLRRFLPGS